MGQLRTPSLIGKACAPIYLAACLGRLPPNVRLGWQTRSNLDYRSHVVSSSVFFRLLSARTLSGRTGTAIDGRVIKFHGFSFPPSALRWSKVSHRLRLSTRENTGLCLALSAFFSHASFPSYSSSLSFLPWKDSRHRVMNIIVVARRSDLTNRHGLAIATQVNIVSRISFSRRLIHLTPALFSVSFRSFDVTEPDTQL